MNKKTQKNSKKEASQYIYVQQRLCLIVLTYMPNNLVLLKRLLNAEKE